MQGAGPEAIQPPPNKFFGDAFQAVPEPVQHAQNRVENLDGAIKLACVTPQIMGSKSFHGVKWLCLSPCNPPSSPDNSTCPRAQHSPNTLCSAAGCYEQGYPGNLALHCLCFRGLHQRARRPAPRVQVGQGLGALGDRQGHEGRAGEREGAVQKSHPCLLPCEKSFEDRRRRRRRKKNNSQKRLTCDRKCFLLRNSFSFF